MSTADGLTGALAQAEPGQVIGLADGVYSGRFVATRAGTEQRPVYLCGGAGAVLDGGGTHGGYVLHLDGASYWHLVGFTVRNGQKGLVADNTQHAVIQQLTVHDVGDEAIHLRRFSSDNQVLANTVRQTGSRRDKFGEGVYVGSAESNWCADSDCRPDTSDRNLVQGNDIGATTAESVDVKEGSTGGVISGNVFDGSALAEADSWVDVKGNDWLIEDNTGTSSIRDGFQTHQVVAGWGTGNTFRHNTAAVNGPGHGFTLNPPLDNVITCDNTATGAAAGLADAPCR